MTPNKNYDRGTRLEYKIKAFLEAEGYYVMRAAGSHGPADLIAIGGETCLAIQVKRHTVGRSMRGYDKLLEIPAAPWLKRQVWTWELRSEFPTVLWSEGEELYV